MSDDSIKFPFIVICILAIAAGLWLYDPSPLYFLNDDFIHIPLSKDLVLFQRKSFRPVCDLSVALDYFLWKKEAWGYHLTNLLLHLADSLLVYVLVKMLFEKYVSKNNKAMSVFAAVLFFIYPFHSEAIYWIIGRSGGLGALFFLPALIFYLRRNEKPTYLFFSLCFFSVGLLTYESVWIFPLVAAGISILDINAKSAVVKKEARWLIIIIGLFIAFLIIRYAVIGEVAGNYDAAAFKHLQIKNLLLNGLRLFIRSFAPPVENVLGFFYALIIIIVLILSALIVLRKNKNSSSLTIFLFASFIASLLPYLSLGIDTHGTEGERFLYLPSVFICMLIGHFIFCFINARVRIYVIFLVIIYCISFLFSSQKNYSKAGKISQLTIGALQKIEGKKRLFVDSLPAECNGAVIFRSGFYEAVKWMKPAPAFENIFVLSSKPNMGNGANFRVLYKDTTFLQKQRSLIADYNQATDVVLLYSDTTLVNVR